MTLYKLVQDVCNLGKAEPNISFVSQGDIYQLNHNQDIDYPAFIVTQGTHTGSDYDEEQFTLTLFAVDRLVSDKSNEIDVQSWANDVLMDVTRKIEEFYIGTVQPGFKIQTFTEKFDSLCAGAYATIAVTIENNDCDCGDKTIGFVTSVNGKTGDVIIKGYEGAAVTSVNGKTGDVYLNIPQKVSDLKNDVHYASESYVNNNIKNVSTYISNTYIKKEEPLVLDDYYTKEEVDEKIIDVSVEIDLSDYYTKEEIYNKQEIETKIAQAGVSSVKSVNGQTGEVMLNYVDISDYNQFIQDQQTIDEAQNDQLEAHGRDISDLAQTLPGKQDKLESGTNIKTINGLSLLGSGNIVIKQENPEYDHQNILYADYQELPESEKLKNIVYQITDYDIYFVKKTEYLLKIMELEDRITALERNLNN